MEGKKRMDRKLERKKKLMMITKIICLDKETL
jgi:hypothetical protein